jgi:mycoredoxin
MERAGEGGRAGRCYTNQEFSTTQHCDDTKEAAVLSGQLTMYTTPWCGFCRNLKKQLAREGIEVNEVDIERDQAAAQYVMSVNGGNQTVPTVLFPDGTALTNPSASQVKAQLAAVKAQPSEVNQH